MRALIYVTMFLPLAHAFQCSPNLGNSFTGFTGTNSQGCLGAFGAQAAASQMANAFSACLQGSAQEQVDQCQKDYDESLKSDIDGATGGQLSKLQNVANAPREIVPDPKIWNNFAQSKWANLGRKKRQFGIAANNAQAGANAASNNAQNGANIASNSAQSGANTAVNSAQSGANTAVNSAQNGINSANNIDANMGSAGDIAKRACLREAKRRSCQMLQQQMKDPNCNMCNFVSLATQKDSIDTCACEAIGNGNVGSLMQGCVTKAATGAVLDKAFPSLMGGGGSSANSFLKC